MSMNLLELIPIDLMTHVIKPYTRIRGKFGLDPVDYLIREVDDSRGTTRALNRDRLRSFDKDMLVNMLVVLYDIHDKKCDEWRSEMFKLQYVCDERNLCDNCLQSEYECYCDTCLLCNLNYTEEEVITCDILGCRCFEVCPSCREHHHEEHHHEE